MTDKLDFKKMDRAFYSAKQQPAVIELPPIPYLMVDGTGAPEDASYQQAVQLLYSIAFTIKMAKMGEWQPQGYTDFTVPPLEGLWDCGTTGFSDNRHAWKWTSMLRMPEFVTPEVLQWACEQAKKKHPDLDFSRVRLETYEEGLCAQIMHVGPYSEEQRSIDALGAFITQQGLTDDCSAAGRRHHEIYLGDPRRTAPERLKTILRHPVR
ncbi:GyrI-like domain-containing protein [Candidatus Soleaferrea massiliensis]|uniref:GyrI-like domain-containing protein n=1 Tax=Candidatus Soleaferrea massiliensis TaxID=1470354 RepID=UPI000590EA07|nr:GyrI-like domain-containing protein [Candidatus Soleaferrea massiliensis]